MSLTIDFVFCFLQYIVFFCLIHAFLSVRLFVTHKSRTSTLSLSSQKILNLIRPFEKCGGTLYSGVFFLFFALNQESQNIKLYIVLQRFHCDSNENKNML